MDMLTRSRGECMSARGCISVWRSHTSLHPCACKRATRDTCRANVTAISPSMPTRPQVVCRIAGTERRLVPVFGSTAGFSPALRLCKTEMMAVRMTSQTAETCADAKSPFPDEAFHRCRLVVLSRVCACVESMLMCTSCEATPLTCLQHHCRCWCIMEGVAVASCGSRYSHGRQY